MVSRRNYFSIVIMMAVLFFMFQFSQIIKESGNTYDINQYVVEEALLESGADRWTPLEGKQQMQDGDFILFVGEAESETGNIVSQWCKYTKRNLLLAGGIEELELSSGKLPEMILLDEAAIDWVREIKAVEALTGWEVPLVFCNLPDATVIEESLILQNILGIKQVVATETEVLGVQVFEDFLLGGEAVYLAKTQEEEKRQTLDLTVPWYLLAGGTKTYMVGLMDEKQMAREWFPCLIWRNTYGNTKVFAVQGDYMASLIGLGILNAFVYELEPYTIYPVVNAQNILIANFPGFCDENEEHMRELYSRSPQMVFQDVMWPSISAMTKTNNLKLTCFYSPQYDYLDGVEPQGDRVTFYQQQLKEMSSEAGMALKYAPNVAIDEVLERDKAFYDSLDSQYVYQTLYVEEGDWKGITPRIGHPGLLENVRSIAGKWNVERDLLYYLNDQVTVQNITGDARQNTYTDQLTDKSLWSALGYSNVLLDLHDALWPKDSEDQWQHLYDNMSSNVRSYWTAKRGFSQTTLSESDGRVRTFLNLDYKVSRQGNAIFLEVQNTQKESWFILRTHSERILEIEGGSYETLEEDAYLIQAREQRVKIIVEAVNSPIREKETW